MFLFFLPTITRPEPSSSGVRKDGPAVVAVGEETQLESEVWWLEAMLPYEGEKGGGGWRRREIIQPRLHPPVHASDV